MEVYVRFVHAHTQNVQEGRMKHGMETKTSEKLRMQQKGKLKIAATIRLQELFA